MRGSTRSRKVVLQYRAQAGTPQHSHIALRAGYAAHEAHGAWQHGHPVQHIGKPGLNQRLARHVIRVKPKARP